MRRLENDRRRQKPGSDIRHQPSRRSRSGVSTIGARRDLRRPGESTLRDSRAWARRLTSPPTPPHVDHSAHDSRHRQDRRGSQEPRRVFVAAIGPSMLRNPTAGCSGRARAAAPGRGPLQGPRTSVRSVVIDPTDARVVYADLATSPSTRVHLRAHNGPAAAIHKSPRRRTTATADDGLPRGNVVQEHRRSRRPIRARVRVVDARARPTRQRRRPLRRDAPAQPHRTGRRVPLRRPGATWGRVSASGIVGQAGFREDQRSIEGREHRVRAERRCERSRDGGATWT